MELTPAMEKFVLHWGEMGSRWGINRSVAQVHALLYLSPTPLAADEIVETLSIARSNVSMSLKELQGWGLVKTAHVLGDRRDHFETITDVWEMFEIIVEERRRREIAPTLTLLRDCLDEAQRNKDDKLTQQRLANMLDFFETGTDWYEQMRALPRDAVVKFIRAGRRLRSLLGVK